MTEPTATGCSTPGDAGPRWGRAGAALAMVSVLALGLQACGGGGGAGDGGQGVPACAVLAGRWDVFQDGVATCSGSFGSGIVSFRAGGQLLVTQDVCAISADDPPSGQSWVGVVEPGRLQLGGVPGLATLQDAVISQTTVTLNGSIAADGRSFSVTGDGVLAGTLGGVPGACSLTMSMQWNLLTR
ncbi:MAG: hypothetical protein RLZZ584_3492 [Pseudomonadota bacterium]